MASQAALLRSLGGGVRSTCCHSHAAGAPRLQHLLRGQWGLCPQEGAAGLGRLDGDHRQNFKEVAQRKQKVIIY